MADIRLESLRHVYSRGTPFEKTALDDVSLDIPSGQYVAILGHTGSGKSTLIQHLNGLLAPTSGRVLFDGEDIHRSKEALRDIRFRVGLVFQYPEYQLFEETVYRDIAFGPKNMGLSDREIDEHVRLGARFAGVDESLFSLSPLELSGGQKRRIAIAGVMAMEPDVLVLDGMSVSTYAGKGLLQDLSPVLDEVRENDGLLDNIAETWKNEDGIMAVPIRFGLTLASGKAEVLNRLENIASLVELSKEEGALDYEEILQLPEILYYLCSNEWKNEDGTINQEKLEDYVQAVKQITDNFMENASDQTLKMLEDFKEEGITDSYSGELDGMNMEFLLGKSKMNFGVLLDSMNYCGLIAANKKMGESTVKLFGDDHTGVYLPICTVGILDTVREPEEAREFVKYLLSKEGELAANYSGFPVNRAALDKKLAHMDVGDDAGMEVAGEFTGYYMDTGESVSLSYTWPEEEEQEWLKNAAESLTAFADTEQIPRQVVLEETRRCVNGEISTQEAVNSIMQKLNLYLAESGS